MSSNFFSFLINKKIVILSKSIIILAVITISSNIACALSKDAFSIGQKHFQTGDYIRAAEKFTEALYQSRNQKQLEGELKSLRNLWLCYLYLGRYSEALQLVDNFEKISINKNLQNETMFEIGINHRYAVPLYFQLRNIERAEFHAQQVLNIGRRLNNDLLTIAGYNMLSLVNCYHNPKKALEYSKKALEACTKNNKFKWLEGIAYNRLGLAYSSIGDFDQAISAQNKSLKIMRQTDNKNFIAQCYFSLGYALYLKGDYSKAIKNFKGGLKYEKTSPLVMVRQCVNGLALAYEKSNKIDKAIEYYFSSINMIESALSNLKTDDQKIGFMATSGYIIDWHTQYENFIRLLIDDNQNNNIKKLKLSELGSNSKEVAFYYVERTKARQFQEMLAKSRLRFEDIEKSVPNNIIATENELVNSRATNQIQYESLMKSGASSYELKSMREGINQINKRMEKLVQVLWTRYPHYASVKYPRPTTISQIKLKEKEKLFEYMITENNTYLWVIGSSGIEKFLTIPITKEKLTEMISLYRIPFEQHDKMNAFDPELSNRLYTLLLKDALKNIPAGYHLNIIPADPLYLLPFCSLMSRISNDSSGVVDYVNSEYLIDSYAITYSQSASILMMNKNFKKEHKEKQLSLYAIGDPIYSLQDDRLKFIDNRLNYNSNTIKSLKQLNIDRIPNTGYEINEIASFFDPQNCIQKLGMDATETAIKNSNLSSYKYIHFATHGILGNVIDGIDEPALLLSLYGDDKEDGILTMSEIYNFELDSDLAVLSACDTGLGEMIRGEGIAGLTRSFMYSGAQSVLVTLWQIPDLSTARFMVNFYQNLFNKNMDKSVALATSQKFMKNSGYAHPIYWAPFEIYGTD